MISHIPDNYEQWHHCITVACGQALTLGYIDARTDALNNSRDYTTQKFVELYGERQRLKTLQWFKQAKMSLQNS